MKRSTDQQLGAREREIMNAIYRLGRASAAEVREQLSDPPTYSAVRGMLRWLESKGFLRHTRDGLRYIYEPLEHPDRARKRALKHLVHTFFEGSPERAAAALLELSDPSLGETDVDELRAAIRSARKAGR